MGYMASGCGNNLMSVIACAVYNFDLKLYYNHFHTHTRTRALSFVGFTIQLHSTYD